AYCGAPATEILSDLDKILLCGVPPYLPDDYIGVYVDDGKVEIRFAEHFRRPVRFTLPEALALKLAIESLPPGGDDAYKDARRLLLEKIGRILGAEAAEQGGGSRLEATRQVEGRLAAISERRDMNFRRRFDREVKVRFDRSVARYVRESRREDAIEETPDGHLIVTMKVANVPWLLNEVLQYGAAAEIVGPDEVRRAMREHL